MYVSLLESQIPLGREKDLDGKTALYCETLSSITQICAYVIFTLKYKLHTYLDKISKGFPVVGWLSWIPVSVEQHGAKEEVDVGGEGADLWLHLTLVPHGWTCGGGV